LTWRLIAPENVANYVKIVNKRELKWLFMAVKKTLIQTPNEASIMRKVAAFITTLLLSKPEEF
jgi:hypothetical protein